MPDPNVTIEVLADISDTLRKLNLAISNISRMSNVARSANAQLAALGAGGIGASQGLTAVASSSALFAQSADNIGRLDSVAGSTTAQIAGLGSSLAGASQGAASLASSIKLGQAVQNVAAISTASQNAGGRLQGVAAAAARVDPAGKLGQVAGNITRIATASDNAAAKVGKVQASSNQVAQSGEGVNRVANAIRKLQGAADARIAANLGKAATNIERISASTQDASGKLGTVTTRFKEASRAAKDMGDSTERAGKKSTNSIGDIIAKIGLLVLAFKAVVAGSRLFGRAITEAAAAETIKTQFATILRSTELAEERFKELAEFSKRTPFQLLDIAQASKTLETLTKGALSTGSGLELVGDVAAATTGEFKELAVTVGRTHAGLIAGTAVGEPINRLVELGLISNDTKVALKEMQDEGKKGETVWAVLEDELNAFSGSMARLSNTWSGLVSTLKDNISAVLRAFGGPIIDALKPILKDMIAFVATLEPAAKRAGESLARVVTVLRGFIIRMIELFKAGELGGVIKAALILAAKEYINTLFRGLVSVISFFKDAIVGIVGGLVSGIGSAFTTIFDNVGTIMDTMAKKLTLGMRLVVATLRIGLLKAADLFLAQLEKVPSLRDLAQAGRERIRELGLRDEGRDPIKDLAERIRKTVLPDLKPLDLKAEFEKGLAGAASIFEKLRAAIKSGQLLDPTEQEEFLRKAFKDAFAPAVEDARDAGVGRGPAASREAVLAPAALVADSLAKLGGGGRIFGGTAATLAQSQLAEAQKTNKKLDRIVDTLGKSLVLEVVS